MNSNLERLYNQVPIVYRVEAGELEHLGDLLIGRFGGGHFSRKPRLLPLASVEFNSRHVYATVPVRTARRLATNDCCESGDLEYVGRGAA